MLAEMEVRKFVLDNAVFWKQVENFHKLLLAIANAIAVLEGDKPEVGKVIQIIAELDKVLCDLGAASPLAKKEEKELSIWNVGINSAYQISILQLICLICGSSLTHEMIGIAYSCISGIVDNI